METGISTACLYPLETEKSLKLLLETGFRKFEIFFNTGCELSRDYLASLRDILNEYGAGVYSFHLFTSGFEPQMFFSDYPRRFDDSVELYRRYSASALSLGAKIAVFHGDRRESRLSLESYCERYSRLAHAMAEEGVLLAQENVTRCRSALVSNILGMRGILGDEMKFVMDVKQAIRAGEDPLEMILAMGQGIVNAHISDSTPLCDCLLPGVGQMNFSCLSEALKRQGYNGPLITEVYRSDFSGVTELKASLKFTQTLVDAV